MEPAVGDPIGERDREERYFEEEDPEPVSAPGRPASPGLAEGEYDY